MTEPERIKNIEEQINLAGLLPGVYLSCLPMEESAKLKRAVLDLYKLGPARSFKAGADHAMNTIASAIPPLRDASQTHPNALILAEVQKIAALDPRNSYQKPAAAPLSD